MTIIGAGQATTTGDVIMRRASSHFLQFAPLAGCVSLLLAPAVTAHAGNLPVSASAANTTGMTIAVTNCNDHGIGSLRNAVARALSGDTIDMRGLACRRINLTSGVIVMPQDELSLVSRGAAALTIDANRLSSIFRHTGSGWLRIDGMTIARGIHQGGRGGCIFSAGSIKLKNSLVHWCLASDGGGLYAGGAVTVIDSRVLGNTATITGGGIWARDRLKVYRSHICGNHAAYYGGGAIAYRGMSVYHTTFSENTGGALVAYGGGSIVTHSTISGNRSRLPSPQDPNRATHNLHFTPKSFGGWSAQIDNSTISGNISYGATVSTADSRISITNSTIAFNRAIGGQCTYSSAAVLLLSIGIADIYSTILANNYCGDDLHYDVAKNSPQDDFFVVRGAGNLIMSSNMPLPSDTISVDPRLAALARNGGRTKTHALPDDSPAIDAGNNVAGHSYDQRGRPRVKGLRADIGAYER